MIEELRRQACRFGYSDIGKRLTMIEPREGLKIIGEMLSWVEQ
jgi:hypothetical protein